ncbi:MAG: hypothetical protein CFE32_16010 [Alphaproteobacteria bacterium PA3]|nr:MAG: hypothetical protein CFE32_16010 [Alphaproteobacteria bacterium PA3]
MNEQQETASLARIDATRRVYRKAAEQCRQQGATVEETAIAMIFAAFDVAEVHAGAGMAAIEWLRTGCDTLERSLIDAPEA